MGCSTTNYQHEPLCYEGSSPAMVLVLLLGDGTFMTATGQQWMIQ